MSTLSVDTIQGQTAAANVKLPAGSVLQTVHSQTTTSETTTSNSFVDTALHVTITPKYSSSKILITSSVSLYNGSNASAAAVTLKRGSTNLSSASYGFGYIYAASGGGHVNQVPIEFLDSPSTTSATTYRVQFSRGTGVGVGTVYISVNSTPSTITVMEIAQ